MPGSIGNQNAAGPHSGMAANRNAMSHGLRASRRNGTGLGSLPRGASYVRREAGRFQRAVEADVRDVHGSLTTFQSGRCQTAAVNRALAALALRWLRRESGDEGDGDRMPLGDRLGLVQAVSRLLEASDKALKDLGVDSRQPVDRWSELDAAFAASTPESPQRTSSNPDGTGHVEPHKASGSIVAHRQGCSSHPEPLPASASSEPDAEAPRRGSPEKT